MRRTDQPVPDRADFEELFVGEPPTPPVEEDLARGRRAVRRRRARLASGGVTALVLAVVVAISAAVLLGRPQIATPADPASPRLGVPAPSSPPARETPVDTAPRLRYDQGRGYLDRHGLAENSNPRGGVLPFEATNQNSWRLARELLDPGHRHLQPFTPGFTGGEAGDAEMIGEKFGWKSKGQPGEGMVLISVSRPFPGRAPVAGPSGMGQCEGSFADVSTCRKATIAGHRVWVGTLGDGGYVIDFVQADGEVAGIVVDPLFGNDSQTALDTVPISRSDAVRLLADPRLDVIG